MSKVILKLLTKTAIKPNADLISRMRIENFREFPYLYQGDFDYEKTYIQHYLENPQAILITGLANDAIIAISTGLPLVNNTDLLKTADSLFANNGLNPSDYFYFSETIIQENYRGQGLYTKIVNLREQAALEKGYQKGCFASVIRKNNHPLMPANYRSPDQIFKHCGYQKSSMIFSYHWPTIQANGSVIDQENSMIFWVKDLK